MGGKSRFFSVIAVVQYKQYKPMEEQRQNIVEAIALIDIDPTLSVFASEQQKWLTGLEITGDSPRDRPNSKFVALVPGVFLVLTFCENNKDPIYELQFSAKPGPEFAQVKTSQPIHQSIGAFLCYKTEPSLTSGPICDVHMLTIERKSRFGENKQVLNVPHGYKMMSHQLPFGYLIFRKVKSKVQQSFKAVLSQKYLTKKGQRVNLAHLPLFCFPDGIKIVREIRGFATFNFIFTLADGEKVFVSCLIFKQNISEKQREKLEIYNSQNFFHQKALCIITNTRYTDQFAQCLQHLYRLSLSKSEVPFWKVIQSFANNMRLPLPDNIGKVGLTYCYNGNQITFPTNPYYPCISERAVYSIFKFMRVENIISVFEALLLEKKVLFVSQSKTILSFATQAFLSLLYPFKWEQVLIPILPASLRDYLTAPVPLVAGISPGLVDSSIESDSVIVYLDKNQVLNDEDNPPLPEKLLKQLLKKLQKFEVYDPDEVTEFLQNPESTYLFKMQEVQDPNFQSHAIRDIFLDFFLTLMRNYRKYCIKPKQKYSNNQSSIDQLPSFSEIFKMNEFLSDLGMTKIGSFGYKFTQSSVFISFIEKKFHDPLSPQVVFFDQCLHRRKSKKDAVFITRIQNEHYEKIINPQVDPELKGPFFYEQFPSILGQQQNISHQDIEITIEDDQEEESEIINKIQEEYFMNLGFFQTEQSQDPLHSKIKGLLLNKNKRNFPDKSEIENPSFLIEWFLSIYSKQSMEIESLFNEWPGLVPDIKVVTTSKSDYFKMKKNKEQEDKKKVIAIEENGDYQILQKDKDTKIVFTQAGAASSFSQKTDSIVIEVGSHRIKNFINQIIPKQGSFLAQFCCKQAHQNLRASTFKKVNYQIWNIETVIALRDWLHHEKQFATGITHD